MYVPFCGAAVMETLIGERVVLDRIKAEVLSKG